MGKIINVMKKINLNNNAFTEIEKIQLLQIKGGGPGGPGTCCCSCGCSCSGGTTQEENQDKTVGLASQRKIKPATVCPN